MSNKIHLGEETCSRLDAIRKQVIENSEPLLDENLRSVGWATAAAFSLALTVSTIFAVSKSSLNEEQSLYQKFAGINDTEIQLMIISGEGHDE